MNDLLEGTNNTMAMRTMIGYFTMPPLIETGKKEKAN